MTKFDFLADPLEKFPFCSYHQREHKDEQRNGAPSETRARSELFCNEKAMQSDLNIFFCVSFPLLPVSSRAQNNFFANNDDGRRNDSICAENHGSTAARRAWFEWTFPCFLGCAPESGRWKASFPCFSSFHDVTVCVRNKRDEKISFVHAQLLNQSREWSIRCSRWGQVYVTITSGGHCPQTMSSNRIPCAPSCCHIEPLSTLLTIPSFSLRRCAPHCVLNPTSALATVLVRVCCCAQIILIKKH